MTKVKRGAQTSDFDQIVDHIIKKSVVVAPEDPNGGGELPNQAGKPGQKARSTQIMAVFDREAGKSAEQLHDWERETDAAAGSEMDYDEDDLDTRDPDDEQHAENEGDVYDPLSDDEGGDEDLEFPEDEDIYTRGRKRRRVRKSARTKDEDEEEEDEDFPPMNDDDDEDEGQEEEPDDEDDEKSKKRRKQIRKALGADAMTYVDGNEFIKSLTNAVFDMRDDFIAEVRALRSENRQLRKLVRTENRQMAKALVTAQARMTGYEFDPQAAVAPLVAQAPAGQAIRKGMGAPIQRPQRAGQERFNLAKALDVVEGAFENGVQGVRSMDVTILENDRSPQNLSPAAQNVLREANLI